MDKNIKKEIILFLKKEFKRAKTKKALVGLSVGIDSALISFLCKEAGLDLYVALLPYKKRGLKDAKLILNKLKLKNYKIFYADLDTLIDAQINTIKEVLKSSNNNLDKISESNIILRERMIFLHAIASSIGGLVVGTSNLSEHLLGYFTEYGDEACDIFPIAGLWKTQIFELAKSINIPMKIIKKHPTGDIFENSTDEIDLGFSYKDADKILYLYFIKKLKEKDIINKYKFKQGLVKKILRRVDITNYKRVEKPRCYFN